MNNQQLKHIEEIEEKLKEIEAIKDKIIDLFCYKVGNIVEGFQYRSDKEKKIGQITRVEVIKCYDYEIEVTVTLFKKDGTLGSREWSFRDRETESHSIKKF